MSVYDPLRQRLLSAMGNAICLSFSEIEGITGRPLPESARSYDEWWSNEDPLKTTHTQSKAWTTVGFKAQVNRNRKMVTFKRFDR
ncbi:MAG: hypothetical protein EON58_22705 [Alphaproteobacteria bacterium]|nr:MAG: hypothetical protein EON58_22705 [Alphaproteobacteria bacterium]